MPGFMNRQSARAAAGSRSIAARLTAPRRIGKSHAPTMSRIPGCTHSTVIIVLAANEPQLADEFRHQNDRHARDEPVERAPGRKILEGEMRFTAGEEARQNDLRQRDTSQTRVGRALDAAESDGILDQLL